MRTYFNQRDVELGANDVILAMDGNISRENAKFCARAALEGFGLSWRPDRGRKLVRVTEREGSESNACLRLTH